MPLVATIIPIYKSAPNQEERISFNQCLNILYKYPLCIVTYRNLNISYYIDLLLKAKISYSIEYFKEKYFDSLAGYNKLMLSDDFYKRFITYQYILIYQLDAYVFSDELRYWCNMKYDYIGAPWLIEEHNIDKEKPIFAGVGNGGFSLRKVNKMYQILSSKKPIYKPSHIRSKLNFKRKRSQIVTLFKYITQCLGYHNSIAYILKTNKENEDRFWVSAFHHSWIKLKVAPVDVALRFSFEQYPSHLYTLNNNQLPFGCHAWKKYEYQSFWKRHIKQELNN